MCIEEKSPKEQVKMIEPESFAWYINSSILKIKVKN
jgi:hypothetical protein